MTKIRISQKMKEKETLFSESLFLGIKEYKKQFYISGLTNKLSLNDSQHFHLKNELLHAVWVVYHLYLHLPIDVL